MSNLAIRSPSRNRRLDTPQRIAERPALVKAEKAQPEARSAEVLPKPSQQVRDEARERIRRDSTLNHLQLRTENGETGGGNRTSRTSFLRGPEGFVVGRRGELGATSDKVKNPPPSDILRNPSAVNANTPAEVKAAETALKTHEAAEKKALEALTAEQRGQYDKVAETIKDDPVARRALQEMAIDGDFETQEGRETLAELDKLSRQDLAEGLERGPLVADVVQEIHDPSAIAQHGYGTCAATSASIYLARNDPSEYARVVGGLASPEGKVTLKNGDTIQRESGTIDEHSSNPGAERTQSTRLLSPALMEYGRRDVNYDPVQDRHETHLGPFEIDRGSGLGPGDYDRVIEGLTGEKFETEEISRDDAPAELDKIQEATQNGDDVAVGIQWDKDSSHKVLVTRVDDKNVYYINPWGQEEKMTREEMERRLLNVTYP